MVIKMRLFIAVLFSPEFLGELINATDRLRKNAESGNFTRPDNLHLTLAFLGETARADAAARIITETAPPVFELALSGCGRFRRSGGDIVWAGLAENRALDSYATKLAIGLKRDGFELDDRAYNPHITLGREVVLRGALTLDIKPITMQCRKISLMKSERVGGQLTYTEIRSTQLK